MKVLKSRAEDVPRLWQDARRRLKCRHRHCHGGVPFSRLHPLLIMTFPIFHLLYDLLDVFTSSV
jgi:hypothetical protein